MELDFSHTPEVQDFVTVPEGTYVCRVAEVLPGVTRNGHDRWGLRLVVAEGEFVGRQAAWDNVVFTERGMVRARRVFAAFGLPTEGRVNVEPEDLMDREALVTVRPGQYDDPLNGGRVRRNEVPYDGYRPVPEDQQVPQDSQAADDRQAAERGAGPDGDRTSAAGGFATPPRGSGPLPPPVDPDDDSIPF